MVDCGTEGAELPRTFLLVCDAWECRNCSERKKCRYARDILAVDYYYDQSVLASFDLSNGAYRSIYFPA